MKKKEVSIDSNGYTQLLADLKIKIKQAQIRAGLSINRELILLYWQIGKEVLHRQKMQGWGTKVIDRLSFDLRRSFPEMKGFSSRNINYMRAFAEAYPDEAIVQQAAAQLPWFHLCVIFDKIKISIERDWYIQATIQNGWSRDVLVHQIEAKAIHRHGKVLSNFEQTLPKPQSDLARQILKDPYNFDFLTLGADAVERDLEGGLLDHLRSFLVELGIGFAFVGRQYHLEVGNRDFYIDLLFYHLRLRCYVAIELKMTAFKPEYAGKMNFYLSVLDDRLRHPTDQPSIGMILCKSKDKLVVEYSLRDMSKPMGVSAYDLMESLPRKLKGSIPTIKELEEEMLKPKK
jgi:predicted nuclease of restriction endonuclease-like (RecB) superfamily